MKKLVVVMVLICASSTFATHQIASVFSENMVLQRNKTVPVWGTGTVGESVAVSFAGQSKVTSVDVDGKWRVDLDSMSANAVEQALIVTGPSNTITLSGILVGDVWLASGQSNMKFRLSQCVEKESFVDNADNANIRFLKAPLLASGTPQESINASWQVSSSLTVPSLSAIAVIFSQRVQPAIGIPVGVIISSDGSTSAECWVSDATFSTAPFSEIKAYWEAFMATWETTRLEKLQARLEAHIASPTTTAAAYDMRHPSTLRTYPTGTYNGMLHPLFPFRLTGVIWRQGEANSSRAVQYQDLMPALLEDWRTNFEDSTLPFIQAQLPDYGSASDLTADSDLAELREAQYLLTQTQTNVSMAVLIDANDLLPGGNPAPGNIHLKNKHLDGERLAVMALWEVYGQNIPHQGPIYAGMQIDGNEIQISYDYLYGGLLVGSRESYASLTVIPSPGTAIEGFAIAGADQVFYNATATITNGTNIVVSAPEVASPVAVRYAWADNPAVCNLYNDEGFPAAPFRTDSWLLSTEGNTTPRISYFLYHAGKVLDVQLSGSGMVGRTPDTTNHFDSGTYGVYPTGTTIDLSAVPEIGWQFDDWSGDASGSSSPASISMDGNRAVTATFSLRSENFPPSFNSNPLFKFDATVGVDYEGSLSSDASDPNNDPLTYGLLPGGPTWLLVATNGGLSGISGVADVGLNSWAVEVSDGQGETNQSLLKITVSTGVVMNVESSIIQFGGGQYRNPAVDRKIGWDGNYTTNQHVRIPPVDTRFDDGAGIGFADFGGTLIDSDSTVGTDLTMTLVSAHMDLNASAVQNLLGQSWVAGNFLEVRFNQDVKLLNFEAPNLNSETDEQVSVFNIVGETTNFVLNIIDNSTYGFPADTVIAANTSVLFKWEDGAESTTLSYMRSMVVETIPTGFVITPVPSIFAASSSNLVLQWPGMSDKSYTLLSTTNLIDGVWSTNLVSGVEPFNAHTTTVDLAQHFFRVEMVD